MIFFEQCRSVQQVQVLYITLAKIYHPRCRGNKRTMQLIEDEYAEACQHILCIKYSEEDELFEQTGFAEELKTVIDQLILLPNIIIDVQDRWIWITGDAFAHAMQLWEIGLTYSSKKLMWCYRAGMHF